MQQRHLERVQRTAVEPLEPLFAIYAAVCICYLVGFLRFQFLDHPTAFTWIEGLQLLTVAVAGFLVLVLSGSVIALHFIKRKLQKLANE